LKNKYAKLLHLNNKEAIDKLKQNLKQIKKLQNNENK